MALELDGQPFTLSHEMLEKYSRKYVFRVGIQHITNNTRKGDPELKPLEVASMHIVPQYRYFVMEKGIKTPKGLLIYFQTKDYEEGRKKYEYTPARIPIDYRGYLEETDPELNFFLDNHPCNEVVKMDPSHPNHDPKVDSYFSTYKKERGRDQMATYQQLVAKLTLQLWDKQSYSKEEIVAIAQLTVRYANDYKIAHKMYNLKDMDDNDLRTELCRLVGVYPKEMQAVLESTKMDYVATVNKFIDLQLIKNMGSEWVMIDKNNKSVPITKIPTGQDANKVIVDWFQQFDTKGAKLRALRERVREIETRRMKEAEPA